MKRMADPFQAAAQSFGLHSEADAEMLRLLEEISRHHAGLELLPQEGDKIASIFCLQPRENSRAETAGFAIEQFLLGEEVIDDDPIRLQQSARSIADSSQIVERDHRKQFGWVHRTPSK